MGTLTDFRSGINSYLLKHHLPPVTILTSKEDLDNFKAIDDHVFIAYLDSPSSSAKQDVLLQETFTSIAHAHHHRFVFGLVLDRQLAEEELLPVNLNLPCVVSYKIAEDDNEALALAATTPGSQEGDSFTKETLEEFVETTAQSAIEPEPYLSRTPAKRVTPVAKRYRGYVDFVTIDGVEYGHVATSLLELNRPDRSSSSLFPAFVVHSLFNDQVFVYDDAPITAAGVDRFVLDILQGKMSSSSGRGKDEGKVNKNDHDEL
ncbi:hypothetical protein VTN96DRAFT_9717 [Rasamsonia emersonii]